MVVTNGRATNGGAETTDTEAVHSAQDWMKNRSGEINDVPLSALPLPGSHDAGSYGAINLRSRTQEHSVAGQLNAGVRFFDFRVIVDGKVYFSHHGFDHSRDNVYIDSNSPKTLLAQVKSFCENHVGEVVILCFNDFWRFMGPGLVDQYATDGQIQTFAGELKKLFGSLLIPNPYPAKSPPKGTTAAIPTYRTCMDAEQRILVMFNGKYRDGVIWNKNDCLDDHYSGYDSDTKRSWERLSELTVEDQQKYLLPGKRNLARFCVTQAILDYKNGKGTRSDNKKNIENSRNYAGAERMNPMFVAAYEQWWAGRSAVKDKQSDKVLRPNILLMDFVGEFDDFSATCGRLVKQL
jgi:hypothetical protein